MADFVPVDHDPFAAAPADGAANLVPVDNDPFAAAPPAAGQPSHSAILDFFKSMPRGVLKGLSSALSAGGQAAQIEMGQPVDVPDAPDTTAILEKNVTGDLPKPQGRAGKYGDVIGETLGNPASWVGPGGALMKTVTGIGSAAGSEAAGELADKFKLGPVTGTIARLLGGVAGGSVPHVGARIVTPLPTSEARRGLNATLRAEGIDQTAGQATGRRNLQYWENDLSPGINERQGEQLTRAALRRVGENADRATPEVVDRAFTRIGGDFDRVGANNTLQADHRMGRDIVDAWTHYAHHTPVSQRLPAARNYVRDIYNTVTANGGVLRGDVYNTLRSKLAASARQSRDATTSHFYSDMTEALDDAMARSIRRNNSGDIGVLDRARRQYRNMLVVERAASGAGESAANGMLTPAQLASATKAVHGKRAFVRGQGDFADLSRAAQGALPALPDSGTSQRQRINNLLHRLGGIGGAIGGYHASGGAEGAVLGLLAGELAGPFVEGAVRGGARRVLMNPLTQGYLGNQLLPDVPSLFQTAPFQPFTAASATQRR